MRRLPALVSLAVLAALPACGGGESSGGGNVTVFAAASLSDAFRKIGSEFEAANPGVDVTFNFAGSSALAEQIDAGNPADVFASADTSNMDKAVASGAVTATPRTFAHNALTIATPPGNPAGITGLADFANSDLLIGLCAPAVPCGAFAMQALGRAGVTPSVDTNEPDVRSLLTKIESGDLDAGIVYVTDVQAAGDAVDAIEIPAATNVQATYVVAPTTDGNTSRAAAFIAFVLSEEGQAILAEFGFRAAS